MSTQLPLTYASEKTHTWPRRRVRAAGPVRAVRPPRRRQVIIDAV